MISIRGWLPAGAEHLTTKLKLTILGWLGSYDTRAVGRSLAVSGGSAILDEKVRSDTPLDSFPSLQRAIRANEVAKTIRDTPKRATYLYLHLTLAFSAVIWTLISWPGHLEMGFGPMIPLIM